MFDDRDLATSEIGLILRASEALPLYIGDIPDIEKERRDGDDCCVF